METTEDTSTQEIEVKKSSVYLLAEVYNAYKVYLITFSNGLNDSFGNFEVFYHIVKVIVELPSYFFILEFFLDNYFVLFLSTNSPQSQLHNFVLTYLTSTRIDCTYLPYYSSVHELYDTIMLGVFFLDCYFF